MNRLQTIDSPETFPEWHMPWPACEIDWNHAALIIVDLQNYGCNCSLGISQMLLVKYPAIAQYYVPGGPSSTKAWLNSSRRQGNWSSTGTPPAPSIRPGWSGCCGISESKPWCSAAWRQRGAWKRPPATPLTVSSMPFWSRTPARLSSSTITERRCQPLPASLVRCGPQSE